MIAAGRGQPPTREFVLLIEREYDFWQCHFEDQSAPLASLYLGGGTPSLLDAEAIRKLVCLFTLQPNAEVTLEINPEHISAQNVGEWQQAGINRISLGVQSFVPHVRKALGRAFGTKGLLDKVQIIAAEWKEWNLDLVYGHIRESMADWERTLAQAAKFNPPHLSLYALTIENNTALAILQARNSVVVEDDEIVRRWNLAREMLQPARPYEVSNFARAGHEARHNSAYWQGEPYLGLGPGATGTVHTQDGSWRYTNALWGTWNQLISKRMNAWSYEERLNEAELRIESIATGLRCHLGVPLDLIDRSRIHDEWWNSGTLYIDSNRLHLQQEEWIRADGYALALI